MEMMQIDTPALLIDRDIMMDNLKEMQTYADKEKVKLRPHIKTHKMPQLAKLQEELGAEGITVAKIGEAEVMAKHGLKDIFIANQIVGDIKLKRIRKLAETIDISFGIDSLEHVQAIEKVFAKSHKKAQILIEIEVGENRSGVIEMKDFQQLLDAIKKSDHVAFKGIFSHEGHAYKADSIKHCKELYLRSAKRMIHFAEAAEKQGLKPEVVSIGSTPSLVHGFEIFDEITEVRPGTYIFMDASQANVIGSYDRCAATVLTSVISKPTDERVITDVGAKGITMQSRSQGITQTKGLGKIKGFDDVYIHDVYDEHAIIYHKNFRDQIKIGDKVEIIPNHICPVSNLYDEAYLVSEGKVIEKIAIEGRGRLQ